MTTELPSRPAAGTPAVEGRTSIVELHLAGPAERPAVDALRIDAYRAAPWMPGISPAALRCASDDAGTQVMVAIAGGQLVATSAALLAHDLPALRDALDAPRFDPGALRYPVLVSQRTAVAPDCQGRGVVALFRRHYLAAAAQIGAGAVCSGHVAATPNVRGLVRLGYAVHDMGVRVLAGLGSTEEVRTLVCCLPARGIPGALAALHEQQPGLEAGHRWSGPSLASALLAGPARTPRSSGCGTAGAVA